MDKLQLLIEDVYKKIEKIDSKTVDKSTEKAILDTIEYLDKGTLRIVEKIDNHWIVHEWLKKESDA